MYRIGSDINRAKSLLKGAETMVKRTSNNQQLFLTLISYNNIFLLWVLFIDQKQAYKTLV